MGDVKITETADASMQIGGDTVSFETGKIARQADGSIIARCGDTVILATAISTRNRGETRDFLPLTVDYREKFAGAGRIPGGYFRREGKPTEYEILTSRIIDRTIRPLFPPAFRSETQVSCTLLSVHPQSDPQLLALNAASLALHLSDIPWNGPSASIRVVRMNDTLRIAPLSDHMGESSLDLVVSCTRAGLVMVEGEAREEPDSVIVDALDFAVREAEKILDTMDSLLRRNGCTKRQGTRLDHTPERDDESLRSFLRSRIESIYRETPGKRHRKILIHSLGEDAEEKFPELEDHSYIGTCTDEISREIIRDRIIHGSRIDGREMSTVRPISCDVGYLPRAHGSGVFTRGETQAIVMCTLGTSRDELEIDSPSKTQRKRFYIHYNFPSYAVGEIRSSRGPGRREIGHGNLAARALKAVLPDPEAFPYTIRIDSEITESNGSSSMATVCGSTLAMMDAGVPLSAPVAGLAMGLIADGDRFIVLSDITGEEDHSGDMDFKIAGTIRGVTAVQLDNKVGAVPLDVLSSAFKQAHDGRVQILEVMNETIDQPRAELGNTAPRIATVSIRKNRVRGLIGPGGRTIQDLQAKTSTRIEVAENGSVKIYATDNSGLEHALLLIREITGHARVGESYTGTVVKETDYGTYIRLFGSIDGFLPGESHGGSRHTVGERIAVTASGVDERGRIMLELSHEVADSADSEG